MSETPARPDTLNEIGVLRRREIEARIVAPLIERFGQEFGHERVVELAREVVIEVAQTQGAAMAEMLGANDLSTFVDSTEAWTRGGALETNVIEQTPTRYAFNVTRCQYAEMYRELGMADLGALDELQPRCDDDPRLQPRDHLQADANVDGWRVALRLRLRTPRERTPRHPRVAPTTRRGSW